MKNHVVKCTRQKKQFVNNGEGNGAEILHPYKKSVGHITKSNISCGNKTFTYKTFTGNGRIIGMEFSC